MTYKRSEFHNERFWEEHDREDYGCPGCGDDSGPFHVHHIDHCVGNGAMSNLIALCADCHAKAHEDGGPDKHPVEGWKDWFSEELASGD